MCRTWASPVSRGEEEMGKGTERKERGEGAARATL